MIKYQVIPPEGSNDKIYEIDGSENAFSRATHIASLRPGSMVLEVEYAIVRTRQVYP